MDHSTKLISVLFLLLALFSMTIHGRESYFFSKVTHSNNKDFQEDTTAPNKEEQSLNKQVQDPAFYPETQNGYGLYGHESTELPATTTANLPYKTQTQPQTQQTYATNNNYYSKDNEYSNNAFEEQQQNFGERSTNHVFNGYNSAERQGMSDTRFLENGKYYYDVKSDQTSYDPNQYQNSRYNYNGRGGYNGNYYPDGVNQYNKSMQRYQNQDHDFEESQEEQYEP